MLLTTNDKQVIKFIENFDNLTNIEKLRLCIHILESKYTKFDKIEIIELLKKTLSTLDVDNKGKIINFSKFEKLSLIAAKHIEMNNKNKLRVIIEMLWDISQSDFDDPNINQEISDRLLIMDLVYEAIN